MIVNKKKIIQKRILHCVIAALGSCVAGIGSSFVRAACFGSEPYMSLSFSIAELTYAPMSVVSVGVGIIILISLLFVYRQGLGLGTILDALMAGVGADLGISILSTWNLWRTSYRGLEIFGVRTVLFCAGALILIIGCSFYIKAEVGMAPYDAFDFWIVENNRVGLIYGEVRALSDLFCLTAAFLIACIYGRQWEIVNIGSLLLALCVGPLIAFCIQRVAEPAIEAIDSCIPLVNR